MSKKKSRQKKGFSFGRLIALLITLGVLLLLFSIAMPILAIIALLLFFLAACIIGLKKYYKDAEKAKVEAEQKRQADLEAAEAERQALILRVKNGQYAFPEKELYAKCRKAGITSTEDSFSQKKIAALMLQHFQQINVPADCCGSYLAQANSIFERYYDAEQKQIARQKEEDKHPKTGKLTDDDDEYLHNLMIRGQNCTGIEKRRKMLTVELERHKMRLEEARRKIDEGVSSSMAIRDSARIEKKADWAVAGGLASAVGGIGAGIAAAMNVQAKNAEIDARNARNIDTARRLADSVSSAYYGYYNIIDWETKEIAECKKELQEASAKVVMDEIPTQELYAALEIKGSVNPHETDTGFFISIKNSYVPDVPSNVKMVTDGTLKVRLLCDEGTLIDELIVPLPSLGIPCGSSESFKGATAKYMHGEHKRFRMEFAPDKLWLIER